MTFQITGPPGGLMPNMDYAEIEKKFADGALWWGYAEDPHPKFKRRPYSKRTRQVIAKYPLLLGRAAHDRKAMTALVRLVLGPRALLGKRPGRLHSLRLRVAEIKARVDELLEMDAVTLLGLVGTV